MHYIDNISVSVSSLMYEKIKKIENEFFEKTHKVAVENQIIFRLIRLLSILFSSSGYISRDILIKKMYDELGTLDYENIDTLISFLNEFGIIRAYCNHGSGLFSPKEYFYYPGIQGYFDYIAALVIIDESKTPDSIDFSRYSTLSTESIYMLTSILMQEYDYPIVKNKTLSRIIDNNFNQSFEL